MSVAAVNGMQSHDSNLVWL